MRRSCGAPSSGRDGCVSAVQLGHTVGRPAIAGGMQIVSMEQAGAHGRPIAQQPFARQGPAGWPLSPGFSRPDEVAVLVTAGDVIDLVAAAFALAPMVTAIAAAVGHVIALGHFGP